MSFNCLCYIFVCVIMCVYARTLHNDIIVIRIFNNKICTSQKESMKRIVKYKKLTVTGRKNKEKQKQQRPILKRQNYCV